jgi:hypothetical protein
VWILDGSCIRAYRQEGWRIWDIEVRPAKSLVASLSLYEGHFSCINEAQTLLSGNQGH